MREGMGMGTLVKRGGGVGLAFVAETHTSPFNYLYQSKTILSLLFTSSVRASISMDTWPISAPIEADCS